jgi:hypothetical protein
MVLTFSVLQVCIFATRRINLTLIRKIFPPPQFGSCLYSLLHEYWDEEILASIGNTLGTFVKTAKATKQGKYTVYSRICIHMNVSVPILDSICLSYRNPDWIQTLDCEFIPFRCRR